MLLSPLRENKLEPMRCFSITIAAILLCGSTAFAEAYYVARTGFDSNPGTLDQPFRTIQKAASVMVPGDTAYVRAGTYRETVTPARSGSQMAPITFRPYNGESVTVSGADLIPPSAWTSSSGNIYQAPTSWDLGEGNNQVFLDGQMMIEARWPNTTMDVSNPTVAHATGGSSVNGTPFWNGTFRDPSLPARPENYWKGATIHMNPLTFDVYQGPGYSWQTGTVVSSTAGQLSFTWTPSYQSSLPGPKNPYYMTGKLSELDAAGEWFLDSESSTLYFWTPAGDSPAQHAVEAKRRKFAFDLSGRSFINIGGFNLFAATITSDPKSQYLVLDGMNAQYLSHFSLLPGAGMNLIGIDSSGVILNGNNNALRNSNIAFSAGNGVSEIGGGSRVFNNVIHDADYIGNDTSPIAVEYSGPLSRFLIAWNTIYNSGSQGIWDGYFGPDSGDGRILHNDIYNYGLQASDLGCTYTYQKDVKGSGNASIVKGSEFAYNRCHDSSTPAAKGLHFDGPVTNFIIHHNVVWNTFISLNLTAGSTNTKAYNNTFAGSVQGLGAPLGQTLSLPGTELKNNIFTAAIPLTSGATLQNNILPGTDPQFADPAHGNFQLAPSSPAIGMGVAIPPYTDGFMGTAPDIGAYDHRLPPWKAGGEQPIAVCVSAASYNSALAPESIAVAFGTKLATGSAAATSAAPPTSLAGTTVTITDGENVDHSAPLFYVTPTQIAFLIPSDTAPGVAMITITGSDGAISLSSAPVFTAAPSLFSADGSGGGLAAAQVVRVSADGSQTYAPVGNAAIDPGPDTDRLVLILYGTGIRGRSSQGTVAVTIGGVQGSVAYSGPQGTFAGLDQVNVSLPRSLSGRGSIDVVLRVDGLASNAVTINVGGQPVSLPEPTVPALPGELIRNGSFSVPIGTEWTFYVSGAVAKIERPASSGYDGGFSAHISVTTASDAPVNSADSFSAVQFWQTPIPLSQGVTYQFQFWAKSTNARSLQFTLHKGTGDHHSYGLSTPYSLSSDWQHYTTFFKATETASDGQLVTFLGDQVGEVWFEGFSLTPVLSP
jgi:uncharacterized protein (TIGR03437 family)